MRCRGFSCVRLRISLCFKLYTSPSSLLYMSPILCCGFSNTFAYVLHHGFPLAFRHLFPMHASRPLTLRPAYFPCVSLYVVPCVPPYATRGLPLRFPSDLCAFTVGPPCAFSFVTFVHCANRLIHLDARSQCFLVFLVHFSFRFSMNSLMVFRRVPAIFAIPYLFVTPRVSYTLNGTFLCTLLYTFLVHSTWFSFRFPFRFCFLWPSPVRSDIRNVCVLSWFLSGFPSTLALHLQSHMHVIVCNCVIPPHFL